MAIIFLEEKSKKKRLYFLGGAVVIILLIIVVYLSGQRAIPILQPVKPRRIVIDWSVLNHPVLQQLRLSPQIPESDKEMSRDNPFEKATSTSPKLSETP